MSCAGRARHAREYRAGNRYELSLTRGGPLLYPRMRVGILGGSFNPAHEGHLHISLIALKRLGLDRVIWMVSLQNPLKSEQEMASLESRLHTADEMARHPDLVVTDIEQRVNTRYTADTLTALRRRWPEVHFVWLMGADNLIQLPRWRDWNRIMRVMPVAVLDRTGGGVKALHGKAAIRYHRCRLPQERAMQLALREAPAWTFIACRRHRASSTAIRAAQKILQ